MSLRLWSCLCLVMFSPFQGYAKSFETSYMQVDLPETWTCEQIATDWACRPTDKQLSHSASLIFTAKEVAPEDTLSAIEAQLKTPRTISAANGKGTVTSKLQWIKPVELSGVSWFEALHLNRELSGYYTYYAATVTPRLIILINFSFQQSLAKSYQPVLENLRKSISLKRSVMSAPEASVSPQPVGVAPVAPSAPAVAPQAPLNLGKNKDYLMIAAVAVIALLFLALRRKSR